MDGESSALFGSSGVRPVPDAQSFLETYERHRLWPWMTNATIMLGDASALFTLYLAAVAGRCLLNPEISIGRYVEASPAVLLYILAFAYLDLYPDILLHPVDRFRRIFVGTGAVGVTITLLLFLLQRGDLYSRSIFLVMWFVATPSVLIARHVVRRLFSAKEWWGQGAVVVGCSDASRRVIRNLAQVPGIRVIGVISDTTPREWPNDLPPILRGSGHRLHSRIGRAARYVVIPAADYTAEQLQRSIHELCVGFTRILLMPDLPGISSVGVKARDLGSEVGIEIEQKLFQPMARITKEVTDRVLSAVLLLVCAPLMLVIAVAVRVNSKGPVLYRHRRHGMGGRIFGAWKFRTMIEDSDRALTEYLTSNKAARDEWERHRKLANDPRVTKVGAILRRYSLDELPQLWNVLSGDMSLVGPRPIVKMDMEITEYGRSYALYTRVRPGLTGLWQVSGRNDISYEGRVALDEYYVRNWSIWLDVHILGRTIGAVISAKGAY